MDFLGELLAKQQRPPAPSESRKKELAAAQKAQEARHRFIARFEKDCARAIEDFAQDIKRMKMKFKPADKALRGILHDLAGQNSLISHSFGEESVDRYVFLFKKDYPLSEEELRCYREGRAWEPQQLISTTDAKVAVSLVPTDVQVIPDESTAHHELLRQKGAASSSLKRKEREHARLCAADAQLVNVRDSFGNVPVTSKQDRRTMNEVYSDIQAKKRQKQEHSALNSVVISSPDTEGKD